MPLSYGGNRRLELGRFDYFEPGQWNFRCDVCGLKWKSGWAQKRWDNCMCCPLCWEIRNPQDFIKGMPDRPAPPWTRPDPQPVFVGTGPDGAATVPPGPTMMLDNYRLNSKMLG